MLKMLSFSQLAVSASMEDISPGPGEQAGSDPLETGKLTFLGSLHCSPKLDLQVGRFWNGNAASKAQIKEHGKPHPLLQITLLKLPRLPLTILPV